ncbi:TonB-dependent receptor [Asticcacaulis sp. ZE23SCel15]|uniref:TonB-dependent receptor n=1 Tax=Asticcacaulis sp. ZE23SCel15 TaxID=3059027 RepID=UPI00265E807A|nr:TonB-dependent receptor [Asticcacaulis sp. ZE23SCel15]WKL56008.1 TonB-dependent receptor [Asticcacaulis sp. ZE23SCel15]
MKTIQSHKSVLKVGGSLIAILTGLSLTHAATAQDAAPTAPQAEEEIQEVVVTGIRSSLRSAMNVKRNSVQVMDAITAEDIGQFPDKNLGEALQRVTGVQISRQDGEGRGVSIRGAEPNMVRVEVDGSSALSLTVGAGDRAVDFRDLPVEFISRLEVVKSPTADMTEGGIGGTVRIITRRPFDSRRPFFAASAQGIYSDLADKYDPKVSLIGSRLFMDDTLGVLLSASFEKRNLNSNNARTTGWIRREAATSGVANGPTGRDSDINGDGVNDWIPEIPRYIIDRRDTERMAFNSVVEWRPRDGVQLYWEGTYAKADEEVDSMFLQLAGSAGVIDYANSSVGEDNTADHIEIVSTTAFPIDLTYRNILGSLQRTQYTTAIGGKWDINEKLTIDGKIALSSGKVHNDEINATAYVFGVPRAVIDYTGGEGAPNMSFPGLDVASSQGINQADAIYNPRDNDAEETSYKFNATYRPASEWLRSIKGGFDIRETTNNSILYQRTTRIADRTPMPTSSAATVVYNVPAATIQSIINSTSGVNEIAFFETGDLGFSGGIKQWNNNTMDTYYAILAAAGVTDGNSPYAVNPNPNKNSSYQNYLDTWGVEEKTKSGYVQMEFELPVFNFTVNGVIGTRIIDTETTSTGFNQVTNAGVVTFVPGVQSGGYTKALPSLNLRFNFVPNKWVGRFTASEVMARPAPAQLALRRSTDIVGLTGSRGNPDLQPFQATQYDWGLEHYFNADSFASVTLFRKEISSFITNVSSPEVIDGVTYSINRPVNGTDKVTINGVEAGIQYALDFLPAPFNGIGVLANYTHQTDEGYKGTNLLTGEILPFPGISGDSYNASIYYENDRVQARLSYNWREQWLITPSGRGSLPEFNEEYGSLDASANYNVNENWTVFLEGVNLTGEQRIENNNAFRRIGNETFGKRIFFGVRFRN